ncbi:MAG: phenylacetate--CoA ligase family protein, partial [Candidatus Baldrarchaeia archaeon]
MSRLRSFLYYFASYPLCEHAVWNEFVKLNRSQWLSYDKIKRIQLNRLKKIVNYAYRNVPFYHSLMKIKGVKPSDIKRLNDIRKMPILTRKDVQTNFSSLVSLSYPKRQVYVSNTSGSTGLPLTFIVSKESKVYGLSSSFRFFSWYGWKVGDKVAKVWALPHIANSKLAKLKLKFSSIIRNEMLLNSLGITPQQAISFVREINRKKPKIITGYTSALLYISKIIQKYNLIVEDHSREWVVVNQAEMLEDHVKEIIGKAFQTNVYNFYGSREISSIAASCPISPYLHINAENLIVEVIKDNEPVNNEVGKIVITNLREFAMPLIRYEIGDFGEISAEKCECGRGLPSLTRVIGRTSDVLVIREKVFSFPSFRSVFEGLPILRYQIVQKSETELDVFVVTDSAKTLKGLERLITNRFYELLGKDVHIQVTFMDRIPLTPSGKHKFVI